MKLYIQESYDNFTVGEFKQCVTDIYHKYFPNSYIEIKLGTTSSGVIRTSCLKVKCYLDNYANNDDLFNVIFDVWGMRGFHDYDEITEKVFLNVVSASFKTDKYNQIIKKGGNGRVDEVLNKFETYVKKLRTALIKEYKLGNISNEYIQQIKQLIN